MPSVAGNMFPTGGPTYAGPALPHPAGWMMRFVSSVTAAVRAKALPKSVAPVCIEIAMLAMIVPSKAVDGAIVAELVTRQKIWQGWAPLMRTTWALFAVTRVVGAAVVPIKKMYIPEPLRVSVPVKVGAVVWQ